MGEHVLRPHFCSCLEALWVAAASGALPRHLRPRGILGRPLLCTLAVAGVGSGGCWQWRELAVAGVRSDVVAVVRVVLGERLWLPVATGGGERG